MEAAAASSYPKLNIKREDIEAGGGRPETTINTTQSTVAQLYFVKFVKLNLTENIVQEQCCNYEYIREYYDNSEKSVVTGIVQGSVLFYCSCIFG